MAETQQSSYPEFPEKRDLLQPRKRCVQLPNTTGTETAPRAFKSSLEMIDMAAPESSKNEMGNPRILPFITGVSPMTTSVAEANG
ncbi:hypothetical protein T02_6171 [Trichinella nativa]|uniref:Uncharacterized protein n=1 Tax=Trichinella nativa TaxID=6335 RepID=A0A0V1KMB3_9BILA|nr:hypothetical protein T02_6171 [Trichinella nativa]